MVVTGENSWVPAQCGRLAVGREELILPHLLKLFLNVQPFSLLLSHFSSVLLLEVVLYFVQDAFDGSFDLVWVAG